MPPHLLCLVFRVQPETVGVFNGEGPPVPIPNTEVKLTSADDTCLVTSRENRSMPTQKRRTAKAVLLFLRIYPVAPSIARRTSRKTTPSEQSLERRTLPARRDARRYGAVVSLPLCQRSGLLCRGPAMGSSAARGSALTLNLRSDQGIAPYAPTPVRPVGAIFGLAPPRAFVRPPP